MPTGATVTDAGLTSVVVEFRKKPRPEFEGNRYVIHSPRRDYDSEFQSRFVLVLRLAVRISEAESLLS